MIRIIHIEPCVVNVANDDCAHVKCYLKLLVNGEDRGASSGRRYSLYMYMRVFITFRVMVSVLYMRMFAGMFMT